MNRMIDSLWLALGVLPFTFGMAAAAENPSRTAPGVQRQEFGKTADGSVVEVFILTNSKGTTAKVMSYGATLMELQVPDRQGKLADVVLGLDDCAGYMKGHPAMGSTVGRFANRIGGAQFTLNGVVYPLAKNSGKHSIHGGPNGFMKRVWQGAILERKGEAAVRLTYVSADAE